MVRLLLRLPDRAWPFVGRTFRMGGPGRPLVEVGRLVLACFAGEAGLGEKAPCEAGLVVGILDAPALDEGDNGDPSFMGGISGAPLAYTNLLAGPSCCGGGVGVAITGAKGMCGALSRVGIVSPLA